MKLLVDHYEIEAQLEDTSYLPSPHTGAPRQRMTLRFLASSTVHQDLVRLLEHHPDPSITVTSTGDEPARWRLVDTSFQVQGREPARVYVHRWQLDEDEVLWVERLVVDTLSFEPYLYTEAFVENRLIIQAALRLEPAVLTQLQRVQQWQHAVPVIRYGISEVPRLMHVHHPPEERALRVRNTLWLVDAPLPDAPSPPAAVSQAGASARSR